MSDPNALDMGFVRGHFPGLAGDWAFFDNAGGSQIAQPALDPRPYRYVALREGEAGRLVASAFALVREDEGAAVVLDEESAARAGAPPGEPFARITLRVHSDLLAVGLIAAVSGRLAAAGIPVNPFAGLRHDHLLVPWRDRERALAELRALAAASGGSEPAR